MMMNIIHHTDAKILPSQLSTICTRLVLTATKDQKNESKHLNIRDTF